MRASPAGVKVSVDLAGDVHLVFFGSAAPLTVTLDRQSAEQMVEALNSACEASRSVQELGAAADAAAAGEE